MGKKAPKEKKVTKKAETKIEQQANLEVFSEGFYEKVNDFKDFYTEVLQLKAKASDADMGNEFETVRERVSKDLEEASANILKEELKALEKWISEEQAKIQAEINKVQEAYENNRKQLIETGAFSDEELKAQLSPIQKKVDEKQQIFDNYETLLKRASGIYGG